MELIKENIMRETVQVDGLNITVTRDITNIIITNPRGIVRDASGISWKGNITLTDINGDQITSYRINKAIQANSTISFTELDAMSQTVHSKNYLELTVAESLIIQGNVMASNMITAINAGDCGLSVEDVTSLVTAIVEAIA